VRIIPQATAGIVERFGRYHRTLYAGLNMVTPFIDRLRPLIDLREQVVSFPPQPVITRDNLVVGIDTVIYLQVTDPKAATYEVSNYITAVEQLTVTTLRNIVGGMDLETALTSRDQTNTELRQELDEATGKWGIRVGVELKAIEPPSPIQDSMEKQMRADRDKRAAILSAEGKAPAARARGQAEAITTVFRAIHEGNPDPRLLAYQYMQMLPQIAQGDANKVWIGPSEIGKALEGIGGLVSSIGGQSAAAPATPARPATPAAAPAATPATAPLPSAPWPEPTLSGTGPQFDPPIGRHAGLEGWLAGSGRPVHDGTVGDSEGGPVPGAGHAGGPPFDDDPSLV
jgi:regulator of protease activity HflC (stomatin/prohibitin superfamily)